MSQIRQLPTDEGIENLPLTHPMTRRYLSSPATRPVFGLTRCNLRQAAHSTDLNTSASAISSATNACTLSRVFGQRKRTGRMRNLRLGRPQAFFSGLITYTPAAIAMIATTTNTTIWSVSESICPSITNGMDFCCSIIKGLGRLRFNSGFLRRGRYRPARSAA